MTNQVKLAQVLGVDSGEVMGSGDEPEEADGPSFPSLAAFLERQGASVDEDDREWLIALAQAQGEGADPGSEWWGDLLLLRQRHQLRRMRENLADPTLQPGGRPLKPRKG
jgi:hypothetical protein